MSSFFYHTAQTLLNQYTDRFPLLKITQLLDWQAIEQTLANHKVNYRHSQLYLIKIWQLNKKGHSPTLKDTRQDNPKERQLCPKTNLSLKRI